MLELPPTIRFPKPDEIPGSPTESLKNWEDSNLIEGFRLKENIELEQPFKFFAEINIDNSRLWNLFIALCSNMPEEAYLIYKEYNGNDNFGNGSNKTAILNLLSKYKTEVTQDAFLEVGIAFHSPTNFEEIYIPEAKYIRVWSSNEVSFRQVMNEFGLQEIEDLNFVDEFPKVVVTLNIIDENIATTDVIMNEFDSFFNPKKKPKWKFW